MRWGGWGGVKVKEQKEKLCLFSAGSFVYYYAKFLV